MDPQKIKEVFEAIREEIQSAVWPIFNRIEAEYGYEMAVNVAMNTGADIFADSIGLLKNSTQREAIFIQHVVNMAHNVELAVSENTTRELIRKIKKETKP